MNVRALALLSCLAAAPVEAGVEEALADHVLPATAAFAEEAARLSERAGTDCRAEAVRPAYYATFDAWAGLSHLRLGPLEEDGRALAIGFWPDTRGMVAGTLARLLAEADPALADPDAFAEVSVAGRGLFALERLLHEPEMAQYAEGDYACLLTRAIAADLARMGAEIDAGWRDGFANELRRAGAPGNARFLSEAEALRALYTALDTGLEFAADQRLGRPLGTPDRPRPERAEARRSGRSLRNLTLSLEALRDLARPLSGSPIPQTEAAFERALALAERLDDPALAGAGTPQGRLRLEALQQRIRDIRAAIAAEIGGPSGISAGFNSADGD